MEGESPTKFEPGKKSKKKKIAIMEPHEELGLEKPKATKVYRKSIFPGARESMEGRTSIGSVQRESSSGLMFSRLMGSGFPSMASRRWTRRSTMYHTPRFQNNYRLESQHPFNREEVQAIINRYMESFVEDHTYNPKRAKRLAENLSVELKNLVKQCRFERYRVVALVSVGDKFSQDFKASMRFVWDAEKDGYVSFAFEAPSYFIIATVFAVYFE